MVKEMHLQENTLFNLYPMVKGVKGTHNVAQYPRNHVTYALAKLYVAYISRLRRGWFTRNTVFDHDFWVKVTQNVA